METSVQNAKRSTNKIKSGSLFFLEQWELQKYGLARNYLL